MAEALDQALVPDPVKEWTGPNKDFRCIKCMEPVKGWLSRFVFICTECAGFHMGCAMPFPGECLQLHNVRTIVVRAKDYTG